MGGGGGGGGGEREREACCCLDEESWCVVVFVVVVSLRMLVVSCAVIPLLPPPWPTSTTLGLLPPHPMLAMAASCAVLDRIVVACGNWSKIVCTKNEVHAVNRIMQAGNDGACLRATIGAVNTLCSSLCWSITSIASTFTRMVERVTLPYLRRLCAEVAAVDERNGHTAQASSAWRSLSTRCRSSCHREPCMRTADRPADTIFAYTPVSRVRPSSAGSDKAWNSFCRLTMDAVG
jgi:hypothetical protein